MPTWIVGHARWQEWPLINDSTAPQDSGTIVGALRAQGEVARVAPCTKPEHTAWGGLTYYSVD